MIADEEKERINDKEEIVLVLDILLNDQDFEA